MTRLELVIFDCDGVLVDSETLTNKIFLQQLSDHGLDLSLAEFMNEFVGHTMVEATRKMYEKYSYQLTEDFFKQFHASSLRILAQDLEPISGIHEAIDKLTVPFCVASNSAPDKIEVMLQKTNLFGRFKGNIFSSQLVAKPKPAPDIYLLAAQSHQTPVEHCLVIEDTSVGVSAAVAAGMTVFGFSAASDPQKLLDAGAKITFNKMNELVNLIDVHFE